MPRKNISRANRFQKQISLLVLLLAVMTSPSAHAHAMFGSAAPFWSGVLHFLVMPLALAAAAALIVTLAGAAESAVLSALAAAAAITFAAAEWMPPTLHIAAPICMAAVGLFATTGRNPGIGSACMLGIGSGLAAGIAVGSEAWEWGGSLGAALAILVLGSWGVAGLARIQSIPRWSSRASMARRATGAGIVVLAIIYAL